MSLPIISVRDNSAQRDFSFPLRKHKENTFFCTEQWKNPISPWAEYSCLFSLLLFHIFCSELMCGLAKLNIIHLNFDSPQFCYLNNYWLWQCSCCTKRLSWDFTLPGICPLLCCMFERRVIRTPPWEQKHYRIPLQHSFVESWDNLACIAWPIDKILSGKDTRDK